MTRLLPELDMSGEERLHEHGRGAGFLRFQVRGKSVAYYLNDHHGDGILSLCCKASPLAQAELVESDPDQFYVPAYIGAKGWVGIRLDLGRVDWSAVKELLFESYRLQAPKRLSRQLDE